GVERIATAFKAWQEEQKFAKIVSHEQVTKEDYNISPSRYINVADAETHRPIAQILAELEALDVEAAEASAALRGVLEKLGMRGVNIERISLLDESAFATGGGLW